MSRQSRSNETSAPGHGQRLPLSRERVLRAGLELADEQGIDALSMRELGRRLGVEAMSLYNHVANKDDLLDGMLDLVVGEIDLPDGDAVPWREAMLRRAVSAHEAFTRHPWASALLDSRVSSGPERLRYLEWMIGTLRRAGFSIKLAGHAFSAIDSYIYGFGRQQAGMAPSDAGSPESAEAFGAGLPEDAYPWLREMVEAAMRSGVDMRAELEFGLNLILDGLEQALAKEPADRRASSLDTSAGGRDV